MNVMDQYLKILRFVCWVAAVVALAFAILSAFVPQGADAFWYYSRAYAVAWRMAVLGVLCEIALRLGPTSRVE